MKVRAVLGSFHGGRARGVLRWEVKVRARAVGLGAYQSDTVRGRTRVVDSTNVLTLILKFEDDVASLVTPLS